MLQSVQNEQLNMLRYKHMESRYLGGTANDYIALDKQEIKQREGFQITFSYD